MNRLDIYTGFYNSPIGCIEINGTANGLCGIRFIDASCPDRPIPQLLTPACQQIDEYFNNKRVEFNLPIDFNGTDFQVKVWQAVGQITAGSTSNAHEIASLLNMPNAALAVHAAIIQNPLALIVPCHRVQSHIAEEPTQPNCCVGGAKRHQYLQHLEASYLSHGLEPTLAS